MTRIPYYVCPLCGKSTPLKSFNPKVNPKTLGFIQIREGGGRGSGFTTLIEVPFSLVAAHDARVMDNIRERINIMYAILNPEPTLSERLKEQLLEKVRRRINERILGFENPEEVFEEIFKLISGQ